MFAAPMFDISIIRAGFMPYSYRSECTLDLIFILGRCRTHAAYVEQQVPLQATGFELGYGEDTGHTYFGKYEQPQKLIAAALPAMAWPHALLGYC